MKITLKQMLVLSGVNDELISFDKSVKLSVFNGTTVGGFTHKLSLHVNQVALKDK